ncbi:MAG: CRISPR-associated endonuclease Cas1 [Myxococcales bacterium]|nr:CRISPR-associated endonuclease Cas1 [Myxococcales bacterium]
MLNEVVYCPRLYALEHLNGEWADSADTVRGRTVHRRVDQPSLVLLPDPEDDGGEEAPDVVRSVELSDDGLGIRAKLDLVEVDGGVLVPVDYKRGRVPPVAEGAYLPERVQVCAQVLLLRAHGYVVPKGVLYFAGSRRRVDVWPTDELVARTLQAVEEARELREAMELPPPLVDDPRCRGCSLVGICLPDEHNALTYRSTSVRPLVPAREEGLPLYVEARGAKLALQGGEIVVKVEGKVVDRARIVDTSRVVVRGAVSLTSPLLAALAERDVPVAVHGFADRLVGWFVPASGRNVLSRIAQHRVAGDPDQALLVARRIVHGKIANQRTLLRRNGADVPDRVLGVLAEQAERALAAEDLDGLRGIEGYAARVYFEHFGSMLKDRALAGGFDLDGRNRRPPRDPVNALLSLGYAFLAREATNVLVSVGLDAWVGFLHLPRPGRPALALDLMEEFRPIVADSVVLQVLNTGAVGPGDFDVQRVGTRLRDGGRRSFIRAFERRMAEEATHPVFGTKLSYRRILEVQARLMAKAALGEIEAYTPFKVR